jgi:hypothetical protein
MGGFTRFEEEDDVSNFPLGWEMVEK